MIDMESILVEKIYFCSVIKFFTENKFESKKVGSKLKMSCWT